MAQTHLFVDTNVFLEFYSSTKESLGQLKDLSEHLTADGICLHLPEQVLDELWRNRETRLKTAADNFKKESHPGGIPQHMLEYPQASEYRTAVEAATRARNAMINQAATDASNNALPADIVLQDLIDKAELYLDDEQIFVRAVKRMQKGSPPGKPDSVGDQYNWEVLLSRVPDGDLHIVSNDGDYVSALNTGRPHPSLEVEWKQSKNGKLHVYKGVKPFLDRYLADAEEARGQPAAEPAASPPEPVQAHGVMLEVAAAATPVTAPSAEKEAAIEALVTSPTFRATHEAIAKLEQLRPTINRTEAERLLEAAIDNSQIALIASDDDVYAFFSALLEEHLDIDAGLWNAAAEVFGLSTDDSDNFHP